MRGRASACRSRLRSARAVPALVLRGSSGGRGAGGGSACHGDFRRGAVGADGAAEGLRRAWARLLLALHVAEGTRARGKPAGGTSLPLVAARPPGAGGGERRACLRRG